MKQQGLLLPPRRRQATQETDVKTWIANLPLRRKFLVLGLIAALMLALPAALILQANLRQLGAAQRQYEGLAPARAAAEWIRLTQQHRGLSAVQLGGDAGVTAERRRERVRADEAAARAQAAVDALHDERLSATARELVQRWRELADEVEAGKLAPARSLERHTALVRGQLELLKDATHVSQLVLVPDARTYYLQAAVLGQLPRLTEAFAQARGLGVALLSQRQASAEERVRISEMRNAVWSVRGDARKYLELAVEGDAAAQSAIGPAIQAAAAAVDGALEATETHIVKAAQLELAPAKFYELASRAIEQQFKLVDAASDLLADRLARDRARARNEILLVALGCTALALLGVWVMWQVSRGTTKSMAAALQMAQAVAAGDLSVQVQASSRDEVGELLRALARMRQNLAEVVGSVRDNAESVAMASTQIAQGNHDLSQRTEEQASALEQTAASMEQLGATVRHNADNAREANRLAQGASTIAVDGGAVVAQVVGTMKGINESSRRIADIIGVIDGIAFQTNILALNAAVEAARADEQGRGFAVVAGEVRSLAQRSAEAAKEISALITASVGQVEEGSNQVDRAGATMEQVVEAIGRVTAIMGEISHASVEQSSAVAQVVSAVGEMDRTTQQNAALVEESASAAESLRMQAGQLVDAVGVFKLRGAADASRVVAGDGRA